MLAVAAILLSLTYLCSCATSRKTDKESNEQPQTDSVNHFVPTHPPIVVPHPWRENRDNSTTRPQQTDNRERGADQKADLCRDRSGFED